MTKLEAFVHKYCWSVEWLPVVIWVELIGSIANVTYVPGESDMDIVVHGHKRPKPIKKQAAANVR